MLAFILGVFFASFFFNDFFIYSKKELIVFAISFFIFTFFLFLFWKKYSQKKQRKLILFFLLFVFGLGRYYLSLEVLDRDKIYYYNNQNFSFEGVVSSEPSLKKKQKFVLEVKSGEGKKINGRVLVFANLYPKYSYGDYLKIKCKLKKPEFFNGFNYPAYLATKKIYSICYYPKISLLKKGEGKRFWSFVYGFKNKVKALVRKGLNKKESSLAIAMLLGDKSEIGDNLKNDFAELGLSHIIAISGLHIGIIFGLLFFVFLSLGFWRRQSFYLSSIFVLFYIFVIGFPASALRAFLMTVLMFFAYLFGRVGDPLKMLLVSAVFLLILNPKLLLYDVGFQLSFLAMLGIIFLYPLLENKMTKLGVGNFLKIRSGFNLSLAAQFFTWPIVYFNFHYFSLAGLVVNLFVLFLMPILMSALLLAVFASLLFPSFLFYFFIPVHFLFVYLFFIISFFKYLFSCCTV